MSSNLPLATAKTMNSRSDHPFENDPFVAIFHLQRKLPPTTGVFGSAPPVVVVVVVVLHAVNCIYICLSQRGKTQITMSQSNIEVPSLLSLHMRIDIRSTCTAYTVTIWGIKIQYSVLIQGPWTWECPRCAFLFSHSPPQWWWILLEIFWSRSLIGCMTMSTPIQCGTLLWIGFARHNIALSKQHITSDSSKFPGDIIWHLPRS